MTAKPLQTALRSLALPGLLLAIAAPAKANIVTISFSGDVSQVEGSFAMVGDPVTGTVTFDTTGLGPPVGGSGSNSFVATAAGVVSLSETIGGHTIGWSNSSVAGLAAVDLGDYSIIAPPRTDTQIGAETSDYTDNSTNFSGGSVDLYSNVQRLFGDVNDVNTINNVSDIISGDGQTGYFDAALGNYDYYVWFNVTSAVVTNVASPPPTGAPEPASLGLLAAGLLGFGALRRSRPG